MRVKQTTLSLLILLPLIVVAGNNQVRQSQHEEELPDAELLEFIAEFEPLEDQWIDPIQLNMIFAETQNGKDNK
jgi:hypothetical protein